MALNPVNPIQSGSATATNGSPTITVTGGVDCSFIVPGFVLQIGTRRIVAAISGTAPVSGTSTITLAANWDQPTTTDVLIGWNSYESLPNIVNRIQNALGQQTAIGELSTNGLIEKTGTNAYQTVTVTAFAKTLLDDADAAAARTTLGAQASDATLTAMAGVTTAANKIIYFTGVDAAAAADLSAYGRTLIATADAAAARTALSAQPLDATLTAVAGVTTAANKIIYFTGVDAAAAADLSAFGRSVIAAADAAAVNTLLGLNVSHLKALPAAVNAQAGTAYNVIGFYSGWAALTAQPSGGGAIAWQPSASKSLHNGVTHFAPEAIAAWDGTKSGIATLLNWVGSGTGVFVRVQTGFISPEMAGADGGTDDTAPYQSAINYCVASKAKLTIRSDARVENITIAGDVSIESSGHTIRIVAGSTQRRIFRVTSGSLNLKRTIVNATEGSVGNVCVLVEGGAINADECQFTGAKLISGYGEGVMVFTSALQSSFVSCKFYGNGGDGLTVYDAAAVNVRDCEAYSNGYGGMVFNNQTTPVGTKKISNVTISDSNCYSNGRSGLVFGNPYNDHNASGDNFGHTNKTCENVKVSNVSAFNNGIYGIGISCYGGRFDNISAYGNTFGGVLVNGRYIDIVNPVVTLNGSYGIDVGFGRDVNITGGEVSFNSATLNAGGLLLEACLSVNVSGTKVFGNGPVNTGWNVIIAGVGGTGDGRYFPVVADQITVNCEVDCSDSRNGMRVDDAATSIIDNNIYKGTDPLKYTRYATHTGELNNSGATARRAYYSVNPAGNVLVVPDVTHNILTNSTDAINSVRPYSWDFFRTKIPYIRVSAQGTGYNPATTTVTITGDGTGAAATAFVNGGKVIGIRMTNFGSGYTTATATISGGGGSGATLVAQVGMPLLSSSRVTICHNQAGSFLMAGPPVINTPANPSSLTAPNRGAITMIERYGQWIVESSNYGM